MIRTSFNRILLLAIFLCALPAVALFGPPSKTVKGRVNFVQPTNFTVLSDDNSITRILVAQDRTVPSTVQVGVQVEVKAVQAENGSWYLDKFEKIGTLP